MFRSHVDDTAASHNHSYYVLPVSELPEPELLVLAQQRLVYERLDWWTLRECRTARCFVAACLGTNPAQMVGALLAMPSTTQSADAWLYWAAIADGHSPSRVLGTLLAAAKLQLCAVGIKRLWCICDSLSWLATNLRTMDFALRETLITMRYEARRAALPALSEPTATATVRLRDVRAADLTSAQWAAIHHIELAAFEPQWQHDLDTMQRMLTRTGFITLALAEDQDNIVGYQCAQRAGAGAGDQAHMTRLVVHPSHQKQGVGRALFAHTLHRLLEMGAHSVTLNTPSSNTHAVRMYKQFGFKPLHNVLLVLCTAWSCNGHAVDV